MIFRSGKLDEKSNKLELYLYLTFFRISTPEFTDDYLFIHIQQNITYQLNRQVTGEKSMDDREVIKNSYLQSVSIINPSCNCCCQPVGIFSLHFPIKQTSSLEEGKQLNEKLQQFSSINFFVTTIQQAAAGLSLVILPFTFHGPTLLCYSHALNF